MASIESGPSAGTSRPACEPIVCEIVFVLDDHWLCDEEGYQRRYIAPAGRLLPRGFHIALKPASLREGRFDAEIEYFGPYVSHPEARRIAEPLAAQVMQRRLSRAADAAERDEREAGDPTVTEAAATV